MMDSRTFTFMGLFIVVLSPVRSQYGQNTQQGQSPIAAVNDGCMRPLSNSKMDIFFIVDSSSSIHEGNFTKMLEFVASIVEKLNVSPNDTRVGLLQFNGQEKAEFSLNSYEKKGDVLKHVRNVRYLTGVTYTGKAIKRVLNTELITEKGYRSDVANVIVVLTDGLAQDDVLTPSNRARDQGIAMFAIGITFEVGQRQLLEITGYKRDHVFLLDDFESFNDILTSIEHELERTVAEVCRNSHNYNIGTTTTGYYASPWGATPNATQANNVGNVYGSTVPSSGDGYRNPGSQNNGYGSNNGAAQNPNQLNTTSTVVSTSSSSTPASTSASANYGNANPSPSSSTQTTPGSQLPYGVNAGSASSIPDSGSGTQITHSSYGVTPWGANATQANLPNTNASSSTRPSASHSPGITPGPPGFTPGSSTPLPVPEPEPKPEPGPHAPSKKPDGCCAIPSHLGSGNSSDNSSDYGGAVNLGQGYLQNGQNPNVSATIAALNPQGPYGGNANVSSLPYDSTTRPTTGSLTSITAFSSTPIITSTAINITTDGIKPTPAVLSPAGTNASTTGQPIASISTQSSGAITNATTSPVWTQTSAPYGAGGSTGVNSGQYGVQQSSTTKGNGQEYGNSNVGGPAGNQNPYQAITQSRPYGTAGIGSDTNVEIRCDDGRIQLALSSPAEKPFNGWVFIKGHFNEPACRFDYQNNTEQHIFVLLKYDRCGLLRQRSSNPPGISFSTTIIFMKHRQFITDGDRAYRLQCFYMEADKIVTQSLDINMLTTQSVEASAEMPACQYTLREGKLQGPPVKTAIVGMKVVHRWDCEAGMNAADVYGIKIHTCYVRNNQGKKALMIDEIGCAVDKYILDNLKYTDDLMTAYVESNVFKFADSDQVFFDCQISLCVKLDGGCNGVSPPNCTSPTRGKRFAELKWPVDIDAPYYNFDLVGETVFVIDTMFDGASAVDPSDLGQIGIVLRRRSEEISSTNALESLTRSELRRDASISDDICLSRFSFLFGAISLLSTTSIASLACITLMCLRIARSRRKS